MKTGFKFGIAAVVLTACIAGSTSSVRSTSSRTIQSSFRVFFNLSLL